jgi:hypothetical protein
MSNNTTATSESNFDYFPDQFTKYDKNLVDENEFGQDRYNQYYEQEQQNKLNKFQQKNKIQQNITQLTVGQYLINMKNVVFTVCNELASQGFKISIFTQDGRLFYIGLFLIILFMIYLVLRNLSCV